MQANENICNGQELITDFQYLVDSIFIQKAYNWLENWDKPYISIAYEGTSYPVYNLYIAYFLMSKEVEVYHTLRYTINGFDYVKSYVEGYESGKSQFEQRWPLKVFQSDNADCHFDDLHRLYCHEPNQIFEGDGWLAAAKYIPNLVNHTAIKYYGYFCAKIAGYDHVVHNYEALFRKMLKCEYTLSEQTPVPHLQSSQTEPYLFSKDKSLFNGMSRIGIEKWFMQLSTRKNKRGDIILTENEVGQFIDYAFFKISPLPVKITANIGRGEYYNFVRLFSEYYQYCTFGEGINPPIDERPNIRDKYIKILSDNFEGFDFKKAKNNFAKKVGLTWRPNK